MYYANYRNHELETPLNLNVIHEDEATKKMSCAQLVQLM